MASIYKKKYPIPIPAGATVVNRNGKKLARWTSGKGQIRESELLADGRIEFVSDYWYVRFRDADGKMRRQSTGCRDKQAAQKILSDTVADVEKIKSGIISAQEKQVASHAGRTLADHVEDYLQHLRRKRVRGRKVSAQYRKNVEGRLNRLVKECRLRQLRDISREAIEKWLDLAEDNGLAPATRNEYLISLSALCNWAVKTNRLANNPVAGIGKADRSSDRRRIRRALKANEVASLLDAARRRPIAEVGRKSIPLPKKERTGRCTWTFEPLTAENFERCYQDGLSRLQEQPARLERLERLGRTRAMFYLLAVSTGLRRKELASLTVGQIHLNSVPTPYLTLKANDAKNARGANLPLRPEVTTELRKYLKEHGQANRSQKLLTNPPTIRVFDADLQAAGIAKIDERGRTADIHALRHTFGTHLSAAGVHPRTAMAAMRHSRIELTMNYYTDPILLDVAGAVNSLPEFTGQNVAATNGQTILSVGG